MWSRGDTVLWRSIEGAGTRIWHAVAATLVELTEDRVVVWVPSGTPTRYAVGAPAPEADATLHEGVWRDSCLRLTRFGEAHSLWLFWRGGAFAGWYVNLQAPLRPSPLGFDTRDHALDVVVDRDGSWRWKDEHHLEEGVAGGWIGADEARAIRAEGERVVAAWPFPTGWEDWRPDPGWPQPQLPAGWDRL